MRLGLLHLKRLGGSKWIKLLIYFSGLFFLTFGLILPEVCLEWAHSMYFIGTKNKSKLADFVRRATLLNNIAKEEAESYFKGLDVNVVRGFYETFMNSSQLDLTIAVITIERDPQSKPGYLTQALSKLDKLIRNNEEVFKRKFNMTVFICDVNTDKKVHQEAQLMEKYFVSRHVPIRTEDHSSYEKEKLDYIYCMEQALQTSSTNLLMLEDDALPNDNIFEVLQHVLTNSNKIGQGHKRHELGHSDVVTNNWAFLKLYYPSRWRGFGWELQHVVDLISIAAIGGCLFLLLIRCLLRQRYRLPFNKIEELVIFIVGGVYCALLVCTIGKPYAMHFLSFSKHLHRVSLAPNCCTPAVLFNRGKAVEIIEYLKTQTCNSKYALDHALDAFASSKHYVKLLIEPNIVTHIGMVSSIKSGSRFPEEFVFR